VETGAPVTDRGSADRGGFLRAQRIFSTFLVLLALFMVVRATVKDRGVLQRNRIFAERLLDGTDPYEGGLHTPYPMSWAMFHAAFLWMPERVERAVWAAMQIGCLALVLRLLDRTLLERVPSLATRRAWILFLTLLVTSRFWIRDMAGGGSNLLILALSFLGAHLFLRGRRLLGALPLGLACALKLTPVLFVPYFLLKRRPAFAAAILGFAAFFFLSPVLVLGPDRFFDFGSRWAQGVLGFLAKEDLTGPESAIIPFEWMNQSLRNALFRYLTECEFPHPLYVHFLRLPRETAAWVIRAVLVALAIAAAWALRRPEPRRDPVRYLAEISSIYLLILLLSPITWRAHYVLSVPAVALLAAHSLSGGPGHRASGILLGIVFLLGGGTSEFFWGDAGKELLQTYYPVTVAGLLLLAGSARLVAEGTRCFVDPRGGRAARLPD
jgi:hypothetical protein